MQIRLYYVKEKRNYQMKGGDLSSFFQVVMAIAQLYWHVAPKSEAGIVAKSLVRLLRSNR